MKTPVRNILAVKGHAVHTVPNQLSVLEAVELMNEHRIGALVVTIDDKPVGILSERDIMVRVVGERLSPHKTLVSEVMTEGFVSIEPTTTVEQAMAIMVEKRFRHLPVMENDVLAGMLSIGDLTRWIGRDQQYQIDDLVNYITR